VKKKLNFKPPSANPNGFFARAWQNIVKENKLENVLHYRIQQYLVERQNGGSRERVVMQKDKAGIIKNITMTYMR